MKISMNKANPTLKTRICLSKQKFALSIFLNLRFEKANLFSLKHEFVFYKRRFAMKLVKFQNTN